MHFGDVARVVDHAGANDDDASCVLARRDGHRIDDVLRAVGTEGRRRAHRASENHRLGRRQNLLQEERRLLDGVGAVRHDDPGDIVLCKPVGAARREVAPDRERHVLAVHLRDLLAFDRHVAQSRDAREQLRNANLRRRVAQGVTGLGGSARQGAAGAQNHDFSLTHLRFAPELVKNTGTGYRNSLT